MYYSLDTWTLRNFTNKCYSNKFKLFLEWIGVTSKLQVPNLPKHKATHKFTNSAFLILNVHKPQSPHVDSQSNIYSSSGQVSFSLQISVLVSLHKHIDRDSLRQANQNPSCYSFPSLVWKYRSPSFISLDSSTLSHSTLLTLWKLQRFLHWPISGHWFPSLMTAQSNWGRSGRICHLWHCLPAPWSRSQIKTGHSVVLSSPPEYVHLGLLMLLLI